MSAFEQTLPQQTLTVVIGAGGMGAAVARRLAQQSRLLVTDLDQARLDTLVASLRAEGAWAEGACCDVTARDSVAALARRASELGGWRRLVHVTGLSPSMADGRTVLLVNLLGPALVTEALMPLAVPGAATVLIASLSAWLGTPAAAELAALDAPLAADFVQRVEEAVDELTPQRAYMLSKIGVVRLARRLAVAWGTRDVRAMSISPGLIASPQGLNEFRHAATKHTLLERCALGRQGGLPEIADAVEYLTSDRASYITGIDLLVDGGVLASMTLNA